MDSWGHPLWPLQRLIAVGGAIQNLQPCAFGAVTPPTHLRVFGRRAPAVAHRAVAAERLLDRSISQLARSATCASNCWRWVIRWKAAMSPLLARRSQAGKPGASRTASA